MKILPAIAAAGLLYAATNIPEPPTAGVISSPAVSPRSARDDASGVSSIASAPKKRDCWCDGGNAGPPCYCQPECKCKTSLECWTPPSSAASAVTPAVCVDGKRALPVAQPAYQQPTGHYETRSAGVFGRRSVQVWVPDQPVGRSTFGQYYSGCASCGGS